MAKFVLKVCKIRGTKISVVRDQEPKELDWAGLCELVKPEDPKQEYLLSNLRYLRSGYFVGTTKGSKSQKLVPFVLKSPDGRPDLQWLSKTDPEAADRIQSIYLVDLAEWDGKFQELGVGGPL
jgi:hypothetical protein